jgi:hypothetical protein
MCPAVLNRDILAFNKTRLTKTLFECRRVLGLCRRGCDTEKANHRHRLLLSARRDRPRRRATEQRDELAAVPVEHVAPPQAGATKNDHHRLATLAVGPPEQPGDEVPHMFTRKPRLQLEKFAINGAKRLLQHNRHFCDIARAWMDFRFRGNSGH